MSNSLHKMKIILFCVFFLTKNVLSAKVKVRVKVDPLVLINQGLVRGEKAIDGDYSTFLGIPYAVVNAENPFGASLRHPGFGDEVFNATDDSIACPQEMIYDGILDCLRLNILVPTKANLKNPMPVLVYIHGGVFRAGKAGLFGGHNLVDQDIIVVTINYRLGVYGFMCLGIPSVPGNQGLKDQMTALRWIQNNIAAFGGNPKNVTIAGQSAGGAAVGYHLFSPTKKLFHKAIIQSGVPLGGGFFANPEEDAAIDLAEQLGFKTINTTQALEFLTSMSPNLVVTAAESLNLLLRPCKEKAFKGVERFISNDPFSLSNKKKIRHTPVLIGVTSNEYYGEVELSKDNFMELLLIYFNFDEKDLEEVSTIIRHFYVGDNPNNEEIKRQLEGFNSDFIINYPLDRTITRLLLEKANPVYEYVYNYVSENDKGYKDNAAHTAELKYIFANRYNSFNEDEKVMSNHITSLWANFIKYGNPTPEPTDLMPVMWEPVYNGTRPYLKIDLNSRMEHRFRKKNIAFWELFYRNYEKYSIFKDAR